MSVIVTLLLLGVLIAIHEAGHFFVARLCGVKVLRFSVGFGKPLLKRTGRDGTEYVLAMIPLGGYVRMLDSRNETFPPELNPFAFNYQSVWRRIAIVAAGPLVNLVFAFVLYVVIDYAGSTQLLPVIAQPPSGSVAGQQGMSEGERIVAIGGDAVNSWQDVNLALLAFAGQTTTIQVSAQPLNVALLTRQALPTQEDSSDISSSHSALSSSLQSNYALPVRNWIKASSPQPPAHQLGWEPWRPEIPAIIGQAVAGGPAELAGLESGDVIVAVDGNQIYNFRALINSISGRVDQQVEVEYVRAGTRKSTIVALSSRDVGDRKVGYLGVVPIPMQWPSSLVQEYQPSFVEALHQGLSQTGKMIVLLLQFVKKLVVGDVSLDHMSGPISITQAAGSSAQAGFVAVLSFMAYLSISLGVLNLLPIPMLDGGHLMYYFIELLTSRPVNEKVQRIGMRVGMALIVFIMLVAVSNDLFRL